MNPSGSKPGKTKVYTAPANQTTSLSFIAWIIAPFAKAEAARIFLAKETSAEHTGGVGPVSPEVIARSLHITKFIVLFGFLSAVVVEMMLPGGGMLGGTVGLIDI